ncbi:hypothetical protein MTBBW1_2560025 [Desulfamplus magnetovallimortis]|uniref:Uncharacterized protein n=1 Tax=Desulfamplus magnetovallimortis TaxID=1246637 RepID=A0A1W1HEQ6_9BACT|nr:hypothetical protein MTBBW1_2560025 [Desulfamplus magnetovallimortis]
MNEQIKNMDLLDVDVNMNLNLKKNTQQTGTSSFENHSCFDNRSRELRKK